MSTLWAVRHAPVDAAGLCYGRSEVAPRIPDDAAAARVLALGTWPIAQVWSSPSARCRGPAEQLAAALAAPLTIDERLYELDFGAWEGQRWDTLAAHDPAALRRWTDDWQAAAPPGGETVADLEQRVRAWWTALARGHDHLLIAHAGVIRALRVIAGADWPTAMALEIPHLTPHRFALTCA
ncbi:MAG: histidine phosphatase family protein [Myxococcales bacterium]|nr:histidine phosphatase family protein [Myxococcales bacterium]